MSPDSSSPLLRDLDPRGVATLTFDRPGVNNAYDGELLTATLLAMDALAREPSLASFAAKRAARWYS